MGAFREFCEQTEFVEFVMSHFNETAPSLQAHPTSPTHQKVWSAKKPEILQMWQNLRPNTPIIITPVSEDPNHPESNYGEDGIRITGTWAFISSVLGRLKEILAYENPQTKLRLIFRGVDASRVAQPNRQSFVFYLNLERRARPKKLGAPKIKPPKGLT